MAVTGNGIKEDILITVFTKNTNNFSKNFIVKYFTIKLLKYTIINKNLNINNYLLKIIW